MKEGSISLDCNHHYQTGALAAFNQLFQMSYIKIWIHFVWATKNRYPFLTKEIRQRVFSHIRENAKLKGIYVDHINGYTEHVHCLISLDANQNIKTIANLLKGESSFWINKTKLTETKFE